MTLTHVWPVDDVPVHALPTEIPECGRVACTQTSSHDHPKIDTGDRVVCEPRLATAPGWAWQSPHGTVVARSGDDCLVDLDEGPRREISVFNLVKRSTWMRRSQRQHHKIRTMGRQPKPLDYGEQLGLDL